MNREDLEKIMSDHPTLCAFGFQTGYWHNRRWNTDKTESDLQQELLSSRDCLRQSLPMCQKAIDWLKRHTPHSTNSYSLKHEIERHTGYIHNGAAIAACIYLGKPFLVDGPNAILQWKKELSGADVMRWLGWTRYKLNRMVESGSFPRPVWNCSTDRKVYDTAEVYQWLNERRAAA